MEYTNAKFRLAEYRFPSFSFDASKPYDLGSEMGLIFDPRGMYHFKTCRFELVIDVQIVANECPISRICCEAVFEFERGLTEIPDYFYANSIAIIYPYIRAFCSLVTTQSNNTGIILPVLNLTSLGQTLKENTEIKEDDTNNQAISSGSL